MSHGSTTSRDDHNRRDRPHKIKFLSALSDVTVPFSLLTGVPIVTVAANGRTQSAILTLSVDRFTAFIRKDHTGLGSSGMSSATSMSSYSGMSSPPMSPSHHHRRTGSGSGGVFSFVVGSKRDLFEERAIDIGEVDRIQRGQATQQFEFAKKHVKPLHEQQRASPLESVLKKVDLQRASSNSSHSSTHSLGGLKGLVTATLTNHHHSSSSSNLSITAAAPRPPTLDPLLSFSILFRGAQTVDLMARSVRERNEICHTLDRILQAYQHAKIRVSTDVLLLRYVWLLELAHPCYRKAQQRQNNTNDGDSSRAHVPAHRVGKVLQAINFHLRSKEVSTAYDKFVRVLQLDRSARRKGLDFEQFATFLHKIKRDSWILKPVTVLWNDLFGEVMNNRKMRVTVSDKTFLEKFLHGKQGQTKATLSEVRKVFQRLHRMEFAHTSTEPLDLHRINKDQFEAYLLASENDAFNPITERVNEEDMNKPLSEYFINSSHNTYLIGDQYKSASSVEMYSNALYRGARCLELDIWDGGKTSSGTPIPVVWHGGTLTTKIRFTDIIKTIKVFLNFHPDTYPIILSFENHCSIPYQRFMAEQLVSILGSFLYVPTESSLYGNLPSPNQLRGRVVIKGRRPDGTEADQYDSDDDSETEEGTASSFGDFSADSQAARENLVKHGVAPELASLTLFHGHKLTSFASSTRTPSYYMHSFSESKVRSKCRHKQASAWIEYNQTHMSRTYPAGSRLDSSNYNPLLAWTTGCQMVALNFQTQDAFLRLNDGRFRENGNCGYVLKPSSLMSKDGIGSDNGAIRLVIKILSGSCIPKPKGMRDGDCIHPYVKVSVYDVKSDYKETITQHATAAVPSNGYFPIWSREKFTFSVENWAVAMLQVEVVDKVSEQFIASTSVPISCLRRGIRSVKLFDATNTRSGPFDFASLLLEIKMEQRVAEI